MKVTAGQELGAFRVGERIGAGGMSDVFEGHHMLSGQRVALKVTTFERRSETMRRAFAAEISAMASFYHPGIVRVYDWGILPDETGNWFAMDWSPDGALSASDIRSWADLRELLETILRALAHAHARRIIHRDLKPANVLTFRGRNRFRLADFGLAHSRSVRTDTRVLGVVAGTPVYMAPEQFQGRWREFGSWTDLYALGCLAYEMAVGRPPISGRTAIEIGIAHITGPRPKLIPRFPVPEGFEAWVHALMAPDWLSRPRVAPTALKMLRNLPEPVELDAPPALSPFSFVAETEVPETLRMSVELEPTHLMETLVSTSASISKSRSLDETHSMVFAETPVPERWRTEVGDDSSIAGVGASLFDIRRTQLVGNEDARDAVWESLLEVVAHGQPRVVTVESDDERELAAFCGWVAEEVRETTDLRTLHITSHADALEHDFDFTLRDMLQAHRLEGGALREHLVRVLASWRVTGEAFVEELAEILEDESENGRYSVRNVNAFYELLEAASCERPLVVVGDAFRELTELWSVARHFQALAERPVLFVLTRETDAPGTTFGERSLLGDPRTKRLVLRKLGCAAAEVMVDSYLRFEPELRRDVVEIAAHDVSHAVDLIRTGIGFELLTPTADGYRLREGIRLSSSFEHLVSIRVKLLRDRFPRAARVITAAAAWGTSLHDRDLNATAEVILDEALRPDEFEALLKRDFLRRSGSSYDFDSLRLRDELAAHVDADDLERLVVRAASEANGTQARLRHGRLLVDVGRLEDGCAEVIDVLRLESGDLRVAGAWMPWIRKHAGRLAESHPLRAEASVLEVRLATVLNEGAAVEDILQVLDDPAVAANPRASFELHYLLSVAYSEIGEIELARQALRVVVDKPMAHQERIVGRSWGMLAWLQGTFLGDRITAEASSRRAIETLMNAGFENEAGTAMTYWATLPAEAGDIDESIARFNRAIDARMKGRGRRFQGARSRLERSTAYLAAGDFARATDDARAAWRYGRWVFRQFIVPQSIQYAICLALTGDHLGAERVVSQARRLVVGDKPQRHLQVDLGRLVLAAIEGDTNAWDALSNIPEDFDFPPVFGNFAVAKWRERGDEGRARHAEKLLGVLPVDVS